MLVCLGASLAPNGLAQQITVSAEGRHLLVARKFGVDAGTNTVSTQYWEREGEANSPSYWGPAKAGWLPAIANNNPTLVTNSSFPTTLSTLWRVTYRANARAGVLGYRQQCMGGSPSSNAGCSTATGNAVQLYLDGEEQPRPSRFLVDAQFSTSAQYLLALRNAGGMPAFGSASMVDLVAVRRGELEILRRFALPPESRFEGAFPLSEGQVSDQGSFYLLTRTGGSIDGRLGVEFFRLAGSEAAGQGPGGGLNWAEDPQWQTAAAWKPAWSWRSDAERQMRTLVVQSTDGAWITVFEMPMGESLGVQVQMTVLETATGRKVEERKIQLAPGEQMVKAGYSRQRGAVFLLVSDGVRWDADLQVAPRRLLEIPLQTWQNNQAPRTLADEVMDVAFAESTGEVFALLADQSVTKFSPDFQKVAQWVAPTPGIVQIQQGATTAGGLVGFCLSKPAILPSVRSVTEPACDAPVEAKLFQVRESRNNRELPLLYVAGGRFFVQLPWDLPTPVASTIPTMQHRIGLTMTGPNGLAVSFGLRTHSNSPALSQANFLREGQTNGQPVLYRGDFRSRLRPNDRVEPGEALVAAMIGLGQPLDGAPADSTAASEPRAVQLPDGFCRLRPAPGSTSVAAVPVPIQYSGLMPGLVGIYQVNLRMPESLPGTAFILQCGGGQMALQQGGPLSQQ